MSGGRLISPKVSGETFAPGLKRSVILAEWPMKVLSLLRLWPYAIYFNVFLH